jgi:hypothetical protein
MSMGRSDAPIAIGMGKFSTVRQLLNRLTIMSKSNRLLEQVGALTKTRAFPYKRELLEGIIETIENFKKAHGPIVESIECIPSRESKKICEIVIKSKTEGKTKARKAI